MCRGNKFWSCEIEAIPTTNWGGVSYIENNWFGGSNEYDGSPRGMTLGADVSIPGIVYVRFNSFSAGDGITSSVPDGNGTGLFIIGNLIGTSALVGSQCFRLGPSTSTTSFQVASAATLLTSARRHSGT